jgi:hypothetical protein
MKNSIRWILIVLTFLFAVGIQAQNPFITDQFTADPTARVFNGKVYVYPSHDIPVPADQPNLRKDWFCMEDYHVFSSENLTDWVDHGVIVNQKDVPWVNGTSYSMWAPDCVEKNGKYYFYFPANVKPAEGRRGGFGVGVGIADKPEGPFNFLPTPIKGVNGIDPCVLIDKDGQAYIYWPSGGVRVAKLKENMVELDGESKSLDIQNLPEGFKEGPFIFERKGKYYLTFPHVRNKTEELTYCMGDSPWGPFKFVGTIMDESPTGCWTNHHSIIEYKGQWYLFYHHNDLSPNFDKNRSIRVDSLFFNEDGTIQKVRPTMRGVGLTASTKMIQLDRYSALSPQGASIEFLDTTKRFNGWKTILESNGAFVRYNAVQFENVSKKLEFKVKSETGGLLKVRIGQVDGVVVSQLKVSKTSGWQILNASVKGIGKGNHDLFVSLQSAGKIEIDWVRFK